MSNITIDVQKSDTWKVQSAIAINFILSKDVHKESVMPSMSDKTEFMIMQTMVLLNFVTHVFQGTKLVPNERENERERERERERESNFVLDSFQLLCYKCHKKKFKCGGSYLQSPNWIKKAVINPKNGDDKYS